MTVMEWSAVIAAAAFVGLAAGLLIALRMLAVKMQAMLVLAGEAKQEVQQLAQQYARLVPPAEQALKSANRQLQSASRLFEAADQIGGAIEQSTRAVHRVSSVLSHQAAQHVERAAEKKQIGEAFEWMEIGMAAWQLWQSRRKTAEKNAGSEWQRTDEGHHKVERSE
ncbi:hypothetical protein [Paenibacillus protaetiae]|uniref:DUF948 domain-containing protein n=1 Tax=Paenibacillus protaetiae TaxID=2509456 RepID=A0A4P6EW91_9BACL|nr:hypothetical protein [Paenibacillus protaetiae]QAY66443.1 hypothetical protein ET464_08500 [Paenibacillus protaetiae]